MTNRPITANKAEITKKILEIGTKQTCIKLPMKNIVFPKWETLGLFGTMMRQCLSTKEQPDGYIYDEEKYCVVLRIIGGRLLMNGRPDCYCWSIDKLNSITEQIPIGTNTAEGLINLPLILNDITDYQEKLILADTFLNSKRDFILVSTPQEFRKCIHVTQELFNQGITYCVDSWMDVDENDMAKTTRIYPGDYLIIEDDFVYRVGEEEFEQTYKIL